MAPVAMKSTSDARTDGGIHSTSGASSNRHVHHLGLVEYSVALERMRNFNATRGAETEDQLWVLEHPAVFTRGISCTSVPRCNPRGIPVVDSDRGGQITYHGPGQVIFYLLYDLRRRGCGVKRLVDEIEQCVIDSLHSVGIHSGRRSGAPGVYVEGRKIASLGLRIKNGCTYHGLSLNVDMDTLPFSWIDPCGYEGLEVVNITELVPDFNRHGIIEDLALRLTNPGRRCNPDAGRFG